MSAEHLPMPMFAKTRVCYAVSRSMARQYATEYPIGDPFGGPAFGEFRDFWSDTFGGLGSSISNFFSGLGDAFKSIGNAFSDVGRVIDREVLQPVGHAIQKVGQAIEKDPITFVATIAAAATGQMWAIPLITMASTAIKGGSVEDVLKAGAISAATTFIAVEGGQFLTNSMKVVEGGATTFQIAGQQISQTTAQTLANMATFTATGALRSAVSGQDILQGAFTGAITASAGFLGNIGDIPIVQDFTKTLDGLGDGVSKAIGGAIAGAAGSGLASLVTGKDMTAYAVTAGITGAIGGLTSAIKIGEDSVASILKQNVGEAGTAMLSALVTNVAATALMGGKANTQLTTLLTASIGRAIGGAIQPGFSAMVEGVNKMFSDTQQIASQLNDAAEARNATVEQRNALAEKINSANNSLTDKYAAYENANKDYEFLFENGAPKGWVTQKMVDAAAAEVDKAANAYTAYESQVMSDYSNTLKPQLDALDKNIATADASLKVAQDNYLEKAKQLDNNTKPLTDMLNNTAKELTKSMATDLDPNFNADQYKVINNLGSDVDAYAHFLTVGKDQGLLTNYDSADTMIASEKTRLVYDMLKKQGYPSYQFVPKELYAKAYDMVDKQYGNDLASLRAATPTNVTQWEDAAGKTLNDYLPKSSASVMRTAFNTKQEEAVSWNSPPPASEYKLPTGMEYASQLDVLNGKATYAITKAGEAVWIKQGANYVAPKQFNAQTGNLDTVSVKTTKVEDLDPYTAVETFASMDKGIVANFPDQTKQLAVTAAQNSMEYAQKTGNYWLINGTATAIKAGGELLKSVGDLSVFLNVSPNSTWSTEVANSVNAIAKAGNTEDYQKAITSMNAAFDKAEGAGGVLDAIIGSAKTYPIEFAMEYIGKEVLQEVPWLVAGGAAATAAKTAASAMGYAADAVKYIGKTVGLTTDRALNLAESAGGEAGDAFNEAQATAKKINPSWSQAQVDDYAFGVAQKVGTMAAVANIITAGVGLDKLPSAIYGGKAGTEAAQTMFGSVIQKITSGAAVVGSETLGESIEEMLPAYQKELLLSQMDSSRDVSKNIAFAGIMGGLAGGGTAGSITGIQAMADLTVQVALTSNAAFTKEITKFKDGGYTVDQFGAVLEKWLPPKATFATAGGTDAATNYAFQTFKDSLITGVYGANPNLFSKYKDPEQLTSDLKALGVTNPDSISVVVDNSVKWRTANQDKINTVAQTIPKNLSTSMKATEVQARDALAKAGLTNITTADVKYYQQQLAAVAVKPVSNAYFSYYPAANALYDKLHTAAVNKQNVYMVQNPTVKTSYDALKAKQAAAGGNAFMASHPGVYQSYLDTKARQMSNAANVPYMAMYPDVYAEWQKNPNAVTAQVFSNYHYAKYGVGEGRVSPATATYALTSANNFANFTFYQKGGVTSGWLSPAEEAARLKSEAAFADWHYNTYGEKAGILSPTELNKLAVMGVPAFSTWYATQYKTKMDPTQAAEKAKAAADAATTTSITAITKEYANSQMISTAEAKQIMADFGYTKPTAAELKQFTGRYTLDQAKTNIGSYVDQHQVTAEEAKKFFTDLGYTPTDKEIASFIKSGSTVDSFSVKSAVGAYVDPRQVTLQEANDYFKALNYTPTEQELSQFIKQSTETGIKTQITSYVNEHQVTKAEVAKMFADAGYKATDEEISAFVAEGDKASQIAAKTGVAAYVDPRMVTKAEAIAAAKAEGYTLSAKEIAQFIGQKDQATTLEEIKAYTDPKFVTDAEAREAFAKLGYTPTDEEVKNYVGKKNEVATLAAIAKFTDPLMVSEAEAKLFFSSYGYTPTDKEVADFVGQRKQIEVQDAIAKYVDPRMVTADEVRAAAAKEGYTITADEAKAFAGQYEQAAKLAEVTGYADARAVLRDEAEKFFNDEGYTPTPEELAKYLGQRNEQETQKQIASYADPKAVTEAEARAFMSEMGYSQPTADEVKQFVKQSSEDSVKAALQSYVNTHQVTEAESAAFYKNLGYVPTKEEIAQFVQQGTTTNEDKVKELLSQYVDPRYVTAEEVKAAYEKLGFATPLQADIDKFVGQYAQSELAGKTSEYLPVAAVNYQSDLIQKVSETLATRISELQQSGASRDAALQQAIDEVATNQNTTKAELLAKLGTTEVGLNSKIAGVEAKMAATEKSILDKMAAYEKQGLDRDTAQSKAIADVSTQLGVTKSQLAAQIGTTEANLNAKLTASQNTLNAKIDSVQSSIMAKMAEYQTQGLTADASLTKAINDVAANLGTTKSLLLSEIGQTETDLTNAFNTKIAATERSILDKVTEYENQGLSRDQALQKAVDSVAANLGTTKDSLLKQIGATETTLNTKITSLSTKLTSVQTSLTAAIDAAIKSGLSGDAALQKAIDTVAANLGTTKDSLLSQLGTTEAALRKDFSAQISGLSSQINTVQTQLTAAIDAAVKSGLSGDAALQKAIDTVAANLGTTKAALLTQLNTTEANLRTDFASQLAGVQTQIGAVKSSLEQAIADAKASGLQGDAALQKAIDTVATNLGTTKADLLTKLGTTEATLKADFATQLGGVQTQLQTDIAKTKQAILEQMAAYQSANMDADTALSLAISGVAQNLGTTKSDLLTKIGSTETALKTELTSQIGGVKLDIQKVAELVGKPVSMVTQADVDTAKAMVSGEQEANLAYDINRDGVVDEKDQLAIEQQLAVQNNPDVKTQVDPNTGLTILVDTKTGQQVDTWNPATGTQWAATGIYGTLAQQQAQAAAAAKSQAASAKQAQQKNNFSQMMQAVLGAPDAAGQKVEVKTPDPARINYMYDWSSIFATPQQAGLMPSPYGAINTYGQPMQGGLGSLGNQQAANQSQYKMAIGGYAEGGMINNDISVGSGGSLDDLLNILKGNG